MGDLVANRTEEVEGVEGVEEAERAERALHLDFFAFFLAQEPDVGCCLVFGTKGLRVQVEIEAAQAESSKLEFKFS